MVNVELCRKFLRKYGYKTTEQGVQKILDTWMENKKPLRDKMSLHPNWNEDAQAIIFEKKEFPKQFTNKPLDEFGNWMGDIIPKYQKSKATEDNSEIYYINKLDDIRAMVRYASNNNKKVEIEGVDVTEIQAQAQQEYDDFRTRVQDLYKIDEDDNKAFYITKEFKKKIDKVYNAIKYIAYYCTDSNITAEQASKINEYLDVNATEGQKLSRVINKLCTQVGINEYRETQTTTNLEGEEITREVGYQHRFNIMAEGITAKTYKVYAIISINPIDFWGMSLMHKAGSCMTIDCNNLERRSSNYSGQYSGGTTTLMLDKNTVVFYTVIEDYHGNLYCVEDKMNRCLFSISDNGTVIIQHRVYPDARDGGDSNKAKFYREIVQNVVSELWHHESNLWTLKKGTYEVSNYKRVHGLHYDDLGCQPDVNVSLLKNHDNEWQMIDVGVDEAICPVCGKKHRNNANILCYDCKYDNYRSDYAMLDIFTTNADFDSAEIPSYAEFDATETTTDDNFVVCEHCGESINVEDALEIDGHFYCDDDCAYEAGYRFIEDDEEYHHINSSDIAFDEDEGEYHLLENMYEDAYTGRSYYGEPAVVTEDGNEYHSIDNALSDGYNEDMNGQWYPEEELIWNDDYGYKHVDDCIEIDGNYYWDEDDARNNGYVETLDDEWALEGECFFDDYHDGWCRINADDVIVIGDNYFADEDSAEDAGYVYHNEEWVREDDLIHDELTGADFTADEAEVVTEDGNYFYCETSAIMAGYRETENGWVLVESERATA